jgi:hypothetical protein
MKAYRGSRGIAPLILNLALDGLSSQLHAPSALPQKKPRKYVNGRLSVPESRSERFGEEKISGLSKEE